MLWHTRAIMYLHTLKSAELDACHSVSAKLDRDTVYVTKLSILFSPVIAQMERRDWQRGTADTEILKTSNIDEKR